MRHRGWPTQRIGEVEAIIARQEIARVSVANAKEALQRAMDEVQMKGPATPRRVTGPMRELKPQPRRREPLEPSLSINLPEGRKARVPLETWDAIRRACRVWHCDRVVASYAAGPHEGITPEIVAAIRRRLIANGMLPSRSYSRRGEA